MKRLLAVVLTLVMMVTLLAVPAFADLGENKKSACFHAGGRDSVTGNSGSAVKRLYESYSGALRLYQSSRLHGNGAQSKGDYPCCNDVKHI